MTGYLEDLETITEENLYRYYQKMIDNDLVDIFIVGDFQLFGSCRCHVYDVYVSFVT